MLRHLLPSDESPMTARRTYHRFLQILLAVSSLSMAQTRAATPELLVAVAANFSAPMTALAPAFERQCQCQLRLAFGSTGQLISQIEQGAPFAVFLAADQQSVQRLIEQGLAQADSRFTYAIGRLVLWSARPDYVDTQGHILQNPNIQHLAVANPKLAPYGAAAYQVLGKLGQLATLKPKLVTGTNITQTYLYVASGNAELGFVALSQLGPSPQGSYWLIPQQLYAPLRQDAVLLKQGLHNAQARALLQYLQTPEVQQQVQQFGYALAQPLTADQER